MKTPVLVLLAVAAVVFAWQVLLDVVIFQITFGFANEAQLWRLVSATLVGLAVAVFSTFVRRPALPTD